MKKFLVFGLTAIAILGIAFMGLTSRSLSRSPSESSVRVFGVNGGGYARSDEYEPASPSEAFAAPSPDQPKGGEEGRMDKKKMKSVLKNFGGLGLLGSGVGGGGLADSLGIGSIGTKGRGAVTGLAKSAPADEGGSPGSTELELPQRFEEPLLLPMEPGRLTKVRDSGLGRAD